MTHLINFLNKKDQDALLDDLNYLNMEEIEKFCDEHGIPYSIWIELEDGSKKKSRDDDRKGIILGRIRNYLKTGKIQPATCFPSQVVCFIPVGAKVKPTDKLYYGQYDKKNPAMIELLSKYSEGKFRNGAIARILAREFWSKGIAPTFKEFAEAWLIAHNQHDKPNAEWAFLADRAEGKNTTEWKQLRIQKAKSVLKILKSLLPQ